VPDISNKATLRTELLARRDALGAEARLAASAAIAARGAELLRQRVPGMLAGYWPIRSEADPRPLIEMARLLGAGICLPQAEGVTLLFREWLPGAPLVPSRFGTQAPDSEAALTSPDALLVPLVGFDRKGNRIGYGRGFYDRALANLHGKGLRPHLIGLAFACQEVATIAGEPHDIALDSVVTEDETLTFRLP
jgi:5-formyltetrahydrofolate cyclo-ligase